MLFQVFLIVSPKTKYLTALISRAVRRISILLSYILRLDLFPQALRLSEISGMCTLFLILRIGSHFRFRGMCHDPSIYSNPDTFDPSRFMPSSTKTPELDPTALVFGFGRRICPGIHIAQVSLFTYVACILSVFNVRFPKKPGGVVSMPEMISGVIRFVAHINSRVSHNFGF